MLGYFSKLINSEQEINNTSPQLVYDLLYKEQNTLNIP